MCDVRGPMSDVGQPTVMQGLQSTSVIGHRLPGWETVRCAMSDVGQSTVMQDAVDIGHRTSDVGRIESAIIRHKPPASEDVQMSPLMATRSPTTAA